MVGSHHADSLGCAAGNEDGGEGALSEGGARKCERVSSAASATSPTTLGHGASLTPHPSSSSHQSEKGAGKSDEENRSEVTRLSWSTSSRRVSSQSRNQFTQLPKGTLRAINKARVFTLT